MPLLGDTMCMPTGRSVLVGAPRSVAPSRPTGPGSRRTHGDRSGGGGDLAEAIARQTQGRRRRTRPVGSRLHHRRHGQPLPGPEAEAERRRHRRAPTAGPAARCPGTEPRAEQTRHGEQRGASASPPAGTLWWRRPAGSAGHPRRRVRCPAARRCGGARAPSPPARPASRRLPYAARSAPISAPAATVPRPPPAAAGRTAPGRSCAPAARRRSPRSPTRPRPATAPGTRRPDAPSAPPPARSRRR
jgi:hypothetical protein